MRSKISFLLLIAFLLIAPLIYRCHSEYNYNLGSAQEYFNKPQSAENLSKALAWSLPYTGQANLVNYKFKELLTNLHLSTSEKIIV